MDVLITCCIFLLSFGFFVLFVFTIWSRGGAVGKGVVLLLLILILYDAYKINFPSDDFYKTEFYKVTDLEFPVSGVILKKYVSYSYFIDTYDFCILIQVSKSDFEKLRRNLPSVDAAKKFEFLGACGTKDKWGVDGDFLYSNRKGILGKEIKGWGLFEEGNLVYIEYSSW